MQPSSWCFTSISTAFSTSRWATLPHLPGYCSGSLCSSPSCSFVSRTVGCITKAKDEAVGGRKMEAQSMRVDASVLYTLARPIRRLGLRSLRQLVGLGLLHGVLIALGFTFLVPLLWVVSTSLK